MKKKIIIINRSLVEAGAEKQSVILASVLQKYYHVTLVILFDIISDVNRAIIYNNNLKLVVLNGDNLFFKAYNFYKLLKTNKPDIIFSYLAIGNLFNGFIGGLANVKYKIGGIRNAVLPSNRVSIEKVMHNRFLSCTISNNHAAADNLSSDGFKSSKFFVIHNAFDLTQKRINRNNDKVINILSVSRFVPQKDFITALEAISQLFNLKVLCRFKFKYFIIGYGKQEQLIRRKISELGIEDVVEVIIKPNNLGDYYRKADIFLSTSLFEGLSNSVMEAMSFSLPVVATPAGDMEYLVKQDENGFLCEMKNPQDIASKLSVLINDYELRKKMGLKSYEIIARNFSMEKFEKNYIDFINKLNS